MGELEQKIQESLEEGFSPQEISKAMEEDGYSHQEIRQAFRNVKREMETQQEEEPVQQQTQQEVQKPETASPEPDETQDTVPGVDLIDDSYRIKQSLVLNRYKVYDSSDNLVLKARQKLFKFKENFPFKTPDGETVLRVKAESIMDIAGDYTLLREEDEEPLAVLDKKYRLFVHKWKIRDPETEAVLASIKSHSRGLGILRVLGGAIPYLPNVFALIPHQYDIESQDGNKIGTIKGKFSIRDIYRLKLEQTPNASKESLVASIIAVDALEGN